MKKTIILIAAALLPAIGFAQDEQEVASIEWIKNVYPLHMSPNGKWLGSSAGDASIYNVETRENVYYEECQMGLAACVANNGMAVGNTANDGAAIMYDGRTINPSSLLGRFGNLNAITPDAKWIVGTIGNPENSEMSFLPAVIPVDENGVTGEPQILPYPPKDFFGMTPQFISAISISTDGNVVVGMVQDWRGMYSYPIYFTKDAQGEWSYTQPTESLFNPTNINIPPSPWRAEPPFPEPENFMSGQAQSAYLEAFENYSVNQGPYPWPEDYMTPAEYNAYVEAVSDYNKWYYSVEDAIKEYIKIYSQVLRTSPSFNVNDMAMMPKGESFMVAGTKETENEDVIISAFYKFNTTDGTYETIESPGSSFYPHQMFSDGTVFITRGIQQMPTTMVLTPGSDKFISFPEYIRPSNPEAADYIEENFNGSGVVLGNEDRTFYTGALTPDLVDYDWDNEYIDYYYSCYFITMPSNAGVETIIEEPTDGLYMVYDLNGVKMLETKDFSAVNELPKGIYIVNGKKIVVK